LTQKENDGKQELWLGFHYNEDTRNDVLIVLLPFSMIKKRQRRYQEKEEKKKK